MSKRLKILVSVLIAVVLLIVGSAATVMAQEEPTQEEPTQEEPTEPECELAPCFGNNALLAKVAELLGMTPEELIDVFEQAQQELKDEAFIEYVRKAAEKGIITPEEAEEIIKWWENRPEAVDRLLPWFHISPAIRSRHMWAYGDNVTLGLFSIQGNARQFKLQWENRINTTNGPVPRLHISNAQRNRQQIAVCKRWLGPRILEPVD